MTEGDKKKSKNITENINNNLHPAEQYAEDVISGKIIACKWTRLACERYFDDLQNGEKRGIYFDKDAALDRLEFYKFCKHSKGEWDGQILKPEPWQQFIQWNIFGWKRISTKKRRFTTVYISVPKKNGKSTDLASTGLYLAFFDNEAGAEVYTAACKYEQAIIIHGESMSMVRKSEGLSRAIKVSKNNLMIESLRQIYRPLGQDFATEDGKNVHGGLIDEYHEHPTTGMYTILKQGIVSRKQPLIFIITTAGFDKTFPCFEMEQRAKRIIERSEEDDSFFSIIYSIDDGDDWNDEKVWYKANPNLGISKYIERMRDEYKEAVSIPNLQNTFKTKQLNIWTEAQTRWITSEVWARNNFIVDAEGLAGRRCFGGLDLSTTTDLTAWVLCFPPEKKDDKFKFLFRFYLPQDNMREREQREKVNYSAWIRDGYITATPGEKIDYAFIKHQVLEDAKKYDLRELSFDPYNATSLVNELMDEGVECVEFRQGFLSMNPACKEFERRVIGGELAHSGNPVMNWMIACTETTSDPAGNIKLVKPDRARSAKHIDGVVASVMAFWRSLCAEKQESAYKDRGIRYL